MCRGGKGALIQTDKSGYLGTSNDQVLFQPVTPRERESRSPRPGELQPRQKRQVRDRDKRGRSGVEFDGERTGCGLPYQQTVGAIAARDYKGVGTQYVEEDKLIVCAD